MSEEKKRPQSFRLTRNHSSPFLRGGHMIIPPKGLWGRWSRLVRGRS
jgi:hypothetical protein